MDSATSSDCSWRRKKNLTRDLIIIAVLFPRKRTDQMESLLKYYVSQILLLKTHTQNLPDRSVHGL